MGRILKKARIYETHVKTTNLEKAITFYESLELELAYVIKDRAAFFWLGDATVKEQMLGVWNVPEEEFVKSHFAFQVSFEELLDVPAYLTKRGIDVVPSFGLYASEPVVHAWMPAASYYFEDGDGNSLEYITVLDEDPIPDLGVVHLSVWNRKRDT